MQKYFNWLCEKTGLASQIGLNGRTYTMLAKSLFEIPYVWTYADDASRASDARALFYDFQLDRTEAQAFKLYPHQPSVLELIYSLAIRIERHFMRIAELGDRTNQWFFEMLHNVGLDAYDDANFNRDSDYYIRVICANWMDHNHQYNGTGGLFPIYNPTRDQRTLSLWSQLNDYMNERV